MNKKILTAAIGAAMIAGPLAAQADLKISGRVAGELISNTGPGIVFGDTGNTRLQFDASNDSGGYLRMAMDMRPLFGPVGAASPLGRDAYLGLKGDFGSLQAGTMANVGKNIEGDPFIATFLEMRNNAVKGGSYGSSSFNATMIQYANKIGDAKIKVQYDLTDNGGKKGDLGASVKTKLAGATVFVSYNNEGNVAGGGFYKLGGAMKFGDIKGKFQYESDTTGGVSGTTWVLGAEVGLGDGAMVDVSYSDTGQDGTNAWYRVGYVKKLNKKTRWFVGVTQNGGSKLGTTANTSTYGGGMRVDI